MRYPTSEYSTVPENWWVLAVAGVVNILFGIVAIVWPGLTLFTLIWLFGFFAIIYGVVELVNMFRTIGRDARWWTHLLVGVISIIAGIVAFAWPGETTVVLLYIIAIWAVLIGLVEIWAAIALGQFFPAIAGVISILFGFILFANPLAGAVALVVVIGIFALVRGALLIIEAIRIPSGVHPAM